MTLELELARDPNSPRTARRALAGRFVTALSLTELDAAQLLVTELVTNAVVHGRGAITLRGELDGQRLLVEVIDQGDGFLLATDGRGAQRDGGWGLALVELESSRWGLRENSNTRVWF